MSEGDLQSFLAGLGTQAEAPSSVSPPSNPAPYVLKAPDSTVSVTESFGPGDANQPICTPITRMASEFNKAPSGRLIAVNENYICYGIKGNLIRVIHFVNITRNKLAGHPASLVDIQLSGRSDDVLASLDVGGTLRFRRIFEASGECQYTTELEVKLPGDAGQKICWAAPGSNAIAVATGNAIAIMSTERALLLASAGADYPVLEPSALAEVGSVCVGHEGTVTDVCFNADFSQLLSGSSDGSVRVWGPTLKSSPTFATPNATVPCQLVLQPPDGASVSSVFFMGDNLLTGADKNSVLQLWKPSLSSGSFEASHRVTLPMGDGAGWTNVAVDQDADVVLCAPTSDPSLVVLHVGSDAFDVASKFDLTGGPILSLDIPREDADCATSEQHLYCIQTKAIQKYSLESSIWMSQRPRPAASVTSPSAITAPKAVAAAVEDARASSPDVIMAAATQATPPNVSQSAMHESSSSSSSAVAVASSSVDLAAMEARMIAAMSKTIDDKLAAHQKAVAKATDAKMKQMADHLSKDIATAAAAAVTSQQKQANTSMESKVKQALSDHQVAQLAALRAAAAANSDKSSQQVVAAVAREVREPVLVAFRQCFQELLVPSLEQATQRMFTQIDAGLDSRFSSLAVGPSAPPAFGSGNPPPAPVDPKVELEAMLEAKQVDEALMKALGARNVKLVIWVCEKVDPGEIEDPLSPTVMLCLLQQLGQNLEIETTLKLKWFKTIALSLNKGADEISAHAPKVISDLLQRIRDFLANHKGHSARQDLEMLLRLL